MSVINSFLDEIKKCVEQGDGNRLTEFMVLNLDGLPPDRQGPYNGLLQELTTQFTAAKDDALSRRVTQSLMNNEDGSDLQRFLTRFSRCVVEYFHYVRDYPTDSNLQKAGKIESLTKKCIEALDKSTPTIIPLVLSFSGTLRSIAINLDRDPSLLGAATAAGDDEDSKISFMENTGNILREAFNKAIKHSKPTDRPSPNDITSGIYLIANSSMQIYAQAGKLRNAEFMLLAIDRNSPPLDYYPASQRVTFLYYLGRFHFANNHFHRAVTVLTSAYGQCHSRAIQQRRRILTHLLAANMILGRLPGQILLRDQAAHAISRPFLQLAQIIKAGDIGHFHTYLDYTNPDSESANWFLKQSILFQIRSRCEVLVWRSLVYHTMRLAGNNLGDETGSGGGKQMPWVRFTSVSQAADLSFMRARQAVYENSNGLINHDIDEYNDPDFAESDDEEDDDHDQDHEQDNNNINIQKANPSPFGSSSSSPFAKSPFAAPQTQPQSHPHANGDHRYNHPSNSNSNSYPDLPYLTSPTPTEINSILLSLISQGLLKGFIQHSQPDLLQSRFAIPGVRKPPSSTPFSSPFNNHSGTGGGTGTGIDAWKEVGFPNIWEVINGKYMEWEGDEGDVFVPGWVTREKVERRNEAGGGAGRVIYLSGARPAGS